MRRLIVQSDLLAFQFFDLGFIGFDHGGVAGFNDTLQKRLNLAFYFRHFRLQRFLGAASLQEAHIPYILEHDPGQRKNLLGGLQSAQQRLCPIFDLGAWD
ncbi:hypothetical protein [Ruegeria jejuensis]|uniref:hypothetical protein n=1 Tax=Ruegeria jejuensis TaxID=3233338 RepID=UPI00355B44BC